MVIELLGLSLLIMAASLSGVFFLWKTAGAFIEKNLCYLVSLSAGVFLVVVYVLARESMELAGVAEGLIWIGVGALFVWALFKFIPTFHHHHRAGKDAHSSVDARRILISDGIHNVGDGIVLAAALSVSAPFAFLAALSIFIHEFVQEVSEFFVLREGGYKTAQALIINFLVSSTILIGALGGYFLLETFAVLEAPLLGLSAGAFLLVVFNDLIPHSIRTANGRASGMKHIIWFLVGLIVMIGITMATPHSHEHGTHDGHAHEEVHEHGPNDDHDHE